MTEDEINVLMEQGAQAGVSEEHETQLVRRVFRLDDLRVTGIMTWRGCIVYLDTTEPREVNIARIREGHHSRFPVTRGGLKNARAGSVS